jgi:hypothetical protein
LPHKYATHYRFARLTAWVYIFFAPTTFSPEQVQVQQVAGRRRGSYQALAQAFTVSQWIPIENEMNLERLPNPESATNH